MIINDIDIKNYIIKYPINRYIKNIKYINILYYYINNDILHISTLIKSHNNKIKDRFQIYLINKKELISFNRFNKLKNIVKEYNI